VRKAGNRVRITGQLIEAETGFHIWADRFEGDYNNIFELQDDITAAVATAVEPRLNLKELERSSRKPTSDLSAYDYCLRAQPLFFRGGDTQSNMNAEKLLRQAIAIDPRYSTALAYLADCIGRQCVRGTKPYDEGILEAAKFSQQAVEADPEDATALAVAAWVFSVFIGRFSLARGYAERALQLQPNSNFVCTNAGYAFMCFGELGIARQALEKAFRLSPLDPRLWFNFLARGVVAFFEKDFEESLSLLTRASDLFPTAPVPWRYKAATLVHLGRLKEAQEAVKVAGSLERAPSLKEVSDRTKYEHTWMRELYLDALKKAGYE
jgi:adenylate cyclase